MIFTDLLEIKDDGTSRESKSFLSDDDENQVFLLLLNYYSTHFWWIATIILEIEEVGKNGWGKNEERAKM